MMDMEFKEQVREYMFYNKLTSRSALIEKALKKLFEEEPSIKK